MSMRRNSMAQRLVRQWAHTVGARGVGGQPSGEASSAGDSEGPGLLLPEESRAARNDELPPRNDELFVTGIACRLVFSSQDQHGHAEDDDTDRAPIGSGHRLSAQRDPEKRSHHRSNKRPAGGQRSARVREERHVGAEGDYRADEHQIPPRCERDRLRRPRRHFPYQSTSNRHRRNPRCVAGSPPSPA